MNFNFKIGDLVGIKSSSSEELIKNCPPGIIIAMHVGYPLSPETYTCHRPIAAILWNDGVENQVDLEWLIKIGEL